MNYLQFAKKWIEKSGLKEPTSDYNGAIGRGLMELCQTLSNQGHSGFSGQMMVAAFKKLNDDYNDNKSDVWQEYWKSDVGKAFLEQHGMTPKDMEDVK